MLLPGCVGRSAPKAQERHWSRHGERMRTPTAAAAGQSALAASVSGPGRPSSSAASTQNRRDSASRGPGPWSGRRLCRTTRGPRHRPAASPADCRSRSPQEQRPNGRDRRSQRQLAVPPTVGVCRAGQSWPRRPGRRPGGSSDRGPPRRRPGAVHRIAGRSRRRDRSWGRAPSRQVRSIKKSRIL